MLQAGPEKSKRYLRKMQVAARYGTTVRNVELKVKDGTLPPPEYFGRFPIWDENELDEADRRRAITNTVQSPPLAQAMIETRKEAARRDAGNVYPVRQRKAAVSRQPQSEANT
jgi:predicted DNA-binding transcriptional regulator AlpA